MVKSTICKSPFIRKEKKQIHTHILGCHPPSTCPAHYPPSQLACLGQGHLTKCLAGVTQPFLSVSTCDRKSCRNLLGNRSPAAPNWELFSPPSSEVVLELLIDASSSHPHEACTAQHWSGLKAGRQALGMLEPRLQGMIQNVKC